jgi:hypothetical protein
VSSFATTWPAITLGLRLQRCATLDAGSFICRHARARSILSRWRPNPKARLRRIEPRPFDQGFDALTEICNRFSPDDCWNVFCEAGYGSNEKRGALGDIPQIIVSSPRCSPLSKSYGKRLCCTNPAGDSLTESGMIAGGHEQLGPYKVQEHELVCLQ